VPAREAELIAREEELVDLKLRVAAADDELQVGFYLVFLQLMVYGFGS
jgi:hypothetical protein